MSKKIRWMTETAIMLAMLVALQAVTKGFGQLVTGSCVNAVLAVSVLLGGLACGLTVALCSPVLAFLFGIAPQILTVPAIMAGNAVFVVLLHVLAGTRQDSVAGRIAAWIAAAAAKFAVLYVIVVWLFCNVLSEALLQAGVMKAPMLEALPVMFSWTQLATALIGGGVAMLILPVLRKALHR